MKFPQISCNTWIIRAGSDEPAAVFPIFPQPQSLDRASQQLPDGAYTTFRTYQRGSAFHLEQHFQRLEDSSRIAGVPEKIDPSRVRRGIFQAIQQSTGPDSRIRLLLDLTRHPGDLYISLEPLTAPSQKEYESGVRVVTLQLRRENPGAKLTQFIPRAAAIRETLPAGAAEGIMLAEDGSFMEGLSSNFFAMIDQRIYTSGDAVLMGITRGLVLDEARKAGIPVEPVPANYADLGRFSEAFITSSSRAVLPVVWIDQRRVGNGKPGLTARLLLEKYRERIDREIEPILTVPA